MRLIDADAFGKRMYHEVFEKDSEDQRWDSGCWMRYRIFEKLLEEEPTIQPVRRGYWTLQNDANAKAYGWHICSECGVHVGEPTNYCPNCGSKMYEEV